MNKFNSHSPFLSIASIFSSAELPWVRSPSCGKRFTLGLFAAVGISSILGCGGQLSSGAGSDANAVDSQVTEVMSGMSLEQKVAQMIQAEIKYITPEDIRRYGLGSILNGGGSWPNDNKHATQAEWVALADAYHEASLDTSEGSAGIPIMWGTDAVHGHNNVIGATLFPHNIALGAAGDAELMRAIAGATAREVKATGIDWIFAPTVAVAEDMRWGRAYESYSADPAVVADYADEVVKGMQGEGIVATAKHFIGDGGTWRGVDQGDTRNDLVSLIDTHGQGYVTAIDANVMTVMASFNSWNGDKLHGSKTLLTDVLRDQLGFDGFVISDWNGIGQVVGCTNDSCPQAINAGVDMVMAPEDWKALLENTIAQVNSGEISGERVDEAVRRILTIKFKSGIMTRGLPSERAKGLESVIGSPAHRAIAAEAVRKSLVMLKNDDQLLPLSGKQSVLVVGDGADNIGQQSGGWTITWQGTGNQNADFPGATSILDGVRTRVEQAGGTVLDTLSEETMQTADVAIVVFGETPYAEGQGDIPTLEWQRGDKRDLALLKTLQAENIPTVAVFLTGRPMWVNAEINASDAFVVAWLPGSEGAAVSDVLFKSDDELVGYDMHGRLPFAWPGQDLNLLESGAPVSSTVFPMGYGLSYRDVAGPMLMLDEEAISKVEKLEKPIFTGATRAPWELYLGDSADWRQPVSSNKMSSQKGEVTLSAIDNDVQEDARRLIWSGTSGDASQFYWQSQLPVDLTTLRDVGAVVEMTYRLNQPPTADVSLRMDCRWPCSGAIEIAKRLEAGTTDDWQTLSIPLICFEKAGAKLAEIDTPFLLSTTGQLGLDIARVTIAQVDLEDALENSVSEDSKMQCQSWLAQ